MLERMEPHSRVTRRAFAHSLDGCPKDEWERLDDHLTGVAQKTADFAAAFGLGTHGFVAGIWHDLGKYSSEFQDRIRVAGDASIERSAHVDHSTWGAQHASRVLGPLGWLPAYCIAGHHAGLADALIEGGRTTPLMKRLQNKGVPRVPSLLQDVEQPPEHILRPDQADCAILQAELRSFADGADVERRGFQLAFLTRMVFSALVDADSLCTERFCEPQRAAARRPSDVPLDALADRLRVVLDRRCRTDTVVNRARAEVLHASRAMAAEPPGLFSLTVPTGGGKTFSSLSFALEHAAKHSMRRVVYAIPFTSIVEQNARVIRDALESAGERVVLEHHCSLDPEQETRWSSRAAENWDAPVIVTTNVQLFDSMFASSRSRCRRLHRLAGSVIVLDEAQSLPVQVLEPCLAALEELVRGYGCSIVLCTATQPAIARRQGFPIGLDQPREIVADVGALFTQLRRTAVDVVGDRSDTDLVDRLCGEPRALCIVNTRRHAAELFAALRARGVEGAYHLSALMCPDHRSEVLARVRSTLAAGKPCRLVSTQVVEAGVDIDFPLVLRAMAGLDSIAQAAGRCNREGRLERGLVEVFETDRRSSGSIAGAAADTRDVLPEHRRDLLAPPAIEAYFSLHYWQREGQWDRAAVMGCFQMDHGGSHPFLADFREGARRFRMIDDAQTAVVVPFGGGGALFDKLLRTERPDRALLRRLQRFTVGVYDSQLRELLERRTVYEHPDVEELYLLANREAYDDEIGLRTDTAAGGDALIT